MATAEEIAASKAAQEQEGFTRTPVTDSGNREADPHVDPMNDVSDPPEPPAPPSGDDDGGQQPRQRNKPVYMSPSDEARANIAKRFRRDEEEAVEFNGDPNDPAMLYGKHGRLADAEPEPEPEPAPQANNDPEPEPAPAKQPRMITLKVRGKDVTKSEEEWLADAAKVTAADSYLEEGRQLLENARTIRKEQRERDPADPHRPEDRNNTQDDLSDTVDPIDPQHPADELEAAIEEVRYGVDSKEAAEKLRKAIAKTSAKTLSDQQLQGLISQDNAKSKTALKNFIESNVDLANDENAVSVMQNTIFRIQRDELLKAGFDETQIPKDNDGLAKFHQLSRVHGHAVSTQEQMLESAKSRFVQWKGGSKQPVQETRKQSASPRVEVTVDRDARRANLPNQPTRTMAPPQTRQQNQPAQARDRSSIIANMRKGRGQIVA